MKSDKYGVGNKFITNDGCEIEIIEKLNGIKRKVRFSDGVIKYVSSCNIRTGQIKHPNSDKYMIETVHKTNNYGNVTVIQNINKKRRLVRFEDGYEVDVDLKELGNGNIKNPYFPNIFGIGFFGEPSSSERKNGKNKRSYATWFSMMSRCYDEKTLQRNPSYSKTTVCEEWHNFALFDIWYNENYPIINGIKFELDKDLLQRRIENKIYSPKTCVFLPKRLNLFLSNWNSNNTSGYTGVVWNEVTKKWIAQSTCFLDKKHVGLGYYINIEDANNAYICHHKKQVDIAKQYLRSLNYVSEDIIQLIY